MTCRYYGCGMKSEPETDPLAVARKAGFDLDLLDSNLALSPEERAVRHDAALELACAFREAGTAFYAEPASSAFKTR